MTTTHSEPELRYKLEDHFNLLYLLLAESKLIPNAAFENINGIQRCLSGIPVPFHNMLIGYPTNRTQWDDCIEEHLKYFQKDKMPFVWYVSEEDSSEFKQKLLEQNFQDVGIFRGVIGMLDTAIPNSDIPRDCTMELVKDEKGLEEFNTLVCSIFGMNGPSQELFKTVLQDAMNSTPPKMFHWVARQKGKVVSGLSTLVKDDIVSYWNAASLPEIRKQGFNTALLRHALQHAMTQGCNIAISYLMAEALALGICNKLGLQTKWHFNVFLAPSNSEEEKG